MLKPHVDHKINLEWNHFLHNSGFYVTAQIMLLIIKTSVIDL